MKIIYKLIIFIIILTLIGINTKISASSDFQKSPLNPVLITGQLSEWDSTSVDSPTVIKKDDRYEMWYDGRNGSEINIGFAHSSDGINWIKYSANPVLSSNDSNIVIYAPTVTFNDGIYHMWLTKLNLINNSSSIAYSNSLDGLNWSAINTVFNITQPWESSEIDSASVQHINGEFRMYYNGNSNNLWKIGFASSVDGINWSKFINNPVISPDINETPTVGAPTHVFINNKYHIFYHIGNPPTRINYAYSTNGESWVKSVNNPELETSISGFDSNLIVAPSVLIDDIDIKLYYTGYDGNKWQIGVATASPELFGSINPSLTPTPFVTETPSPTPTPTATPTPTPTSIPVSKVVILPGFGGSWNQDAITNCKTENYDDDWTQIPVEEALKTYDPLIQGIGSYHLTPLLFYYDWRQDPRIIANTLKSFIDNNTLSDEKVYIIGHSFGGLVARAYLENNFSKVEKIITAGSPHNGIISAYPSWSNGDISGDWRWKFAGTLVKVFCKIHNGVQLSDREIIHQYLPSVQSTLAVFDYLRDSKTNIVNPVNTMFSQNNWLPNNEVTFPFHGVGFGTLSGTGHSTESEYMTKPPTNQDVKSGNWLDGKPNKTIVSKEGDGAVLNTSSVMTGANNMTIGQNHNALVSSVEGVVAIMRFLTDALTASVPLFQATATIISDDSPKLAIASDTTSTFQLTDPNGIIYLSKNGIILLPSAQYGTYLFTDLISEETNLVIIQVRNNNVTLWKNYKFIKPGNLNKSIKFLRDSVTADILTN